MKIIRERICNAVHKCLQWENGEIAGIDMLKLEQQIDGILAQLQQHGVSGKRLTEIIHKAVDETYQTVDAYVNEYVDSTGDEMRDELNSLKDELSAACASGALDTVAARGTCEHECTGPWDCQCQDVIDKFYRGVERKSSEGQL